MRSQESGRNWRHLGFPKTRVSTGNSSNIPATFSPENRRKFRWKNADFEGSDAGFYLLVEIGVTRL